jgi:hypothetical protein
MGSFDSILPKRKKNRTNLFSILEDRSFKDKLLSGTSGFYVTVRQTHLEPDAAASKIVSGIS